jgi:hypothetical protein
VKLYKVVVVEWGDAFIDTDDFDPAEAADTKPVYRKTVGFLIAKNQHGYVLATDTYVDEDEVAAKMFIPHGMVTRVTPLFTRVKKEAPCGPKS